MRHFLFEDKPYRIDSRFKRKRNEQDSAVALSRLLRRFNPRNRTGSSDISSESKGVRSRIDMRQKCNVKMQYSNSIDAHRVQTKSYLTREGTDIDGSNAKLYGTNFDEYQANMVDRNFRIFLSPEFNKYNLKDLSEQFIKKLEQQTGYSLYWQGANHYDRPHHHAHILINGKDKNGKEVIIPRDIVKTFMREYARDICTSQIGHRTNEEIELEKSREPGAMRYTRLDDNIKEICPDNNIIKTNQIYANRERVLLRLENLRKIGLCNFNNGSYILDTQWEESLRANSRYNTFLSARSQLQFSDQSNLKVYSGEHGNISGKVTKIFTPEDDTSNNHAVVIECQDGKAYFVPLLKPPSMYDYKTKIRMGLMEGDTINVQTLENQRGRLTPVFFKSNTRNRN